MKQIFYAATLVLLSASCKEEKAEQVTQPKTVLTEQNMFTKEAVLAGYQHKPGKEATDLFMKGIDLYRNQKNPDAAVTLFMKSILQAPTAKSYYELGNASMDLKNYPRAIQCYDIAEALGFEPVNKIFYNTACAYSLQGEKEKAVEYLKYAVESGYTNGEQIMKDPDLSTARESGVFLTAYNDAMSGSSDPAVLEWQNFKRGFRQAALPMTIDGTTRPELEGENAFISYEYERFVPEMKGQQFSRDVGKSFFYYTLVSSNDDYTALIYVTRDEIWDAEHSPYGFTLASFDGKGQLIDKMEVGGQFSLSDPVRVASFRQDLSFEVKKIENKYAKNPESEGYQDNQVIGTKLLSTEHFRINEKGKFKRDGKKQLIGMR